MIHPLRLVLSALLLASFLAGCATNPVTGGSELGLVSETEEIRIGQSQYLPSQQSQGGRYYLDPALADYVQRVGENLARLSDRPQLPYEFAVLNNSEPNAWALPGGKIAVNRGLLMMLDDESELAAVLGHEIVHAAARHGAQQQEKSILLGAGAALLGIASASVGLQDVVMKGAQIGGAMVQSHYGREAELEADRYGIQYMARAGYDPQGAVRLQERFVKLSAGQPSGGLNALFASHPPSQERVDENRKSARKLAAGDTGRDRFQSQMARLRRDQPAYKAYDKALKSMAAGKYEQALSDSNEAIKLQDREILFHELSGFANARLDRPTEAIRSYNRAIALNPGFYRPYVYRGKLHLERGNLAVAKQDLSMANRLLPSADATFGLGDIAAREGDAQTALRYFEQVAQSDSPLAAAARDRIARLQITR